jgi:outer membrane lipoprotein SlyB
MKKILQLLAIASVIALTGCTLVTYEKRDGLTRFRYISTKDAAIDRITLEKVGSIEGASGNASESMGAVAGAIVEGVIP